MDVRHSNCSENMQMIQALIALYETPAQRGFHAQLSVAIPTTTNLVQNSYSLMLMFTTHDRTNGLCKILSLPCNAF